MSLSMQEKIDEEMLYPIKRLMSDVYSENLTMEEAKVKESVTTFFNRKRQFLSELKQRYGSDYAGCSAAVEIYKDFDAILRAPDTVSMFQEILNRRDSLEDKAETLEQLEGFYREGSSQQKNYQDAKDICSWYAQNCSLQDLSKMEDVINQMHIIIALDMPFSKMNELANLVFQANSAKDEILEDKLNRTKAAVEYDRDAVSAELSNVLNANLTEDQKNRIQQKADSILAQYEAWLSSLTRQTDNMDSYITASAGNLSGFRGFIASVMNEGVGGQVRAKQVRIIDYIPAVNKKVKSPDDVDTVLQAIREKLLEALKDNDEIDLE